MIKSWSRLNYVLLAFFLLMLATTESFSKSAQTDSFRVQKRFEIGLKGAAVDVFPFLKNVNGSSFYYTVLPDSAKGWHLASSWVKLMSDTYRVSFSPTAPGTDYKVYIPWLSGQTDPVLYVGSQNASNTATGIYADSYSGVGLRGQSYSYQGVYGFAHDGANAVGVYGQSSYGIAGSFIQTYVMTKNANYPTLYVGRVFVPGAYDNTSPLVQIDDLSTGGTSGDLIRARVGSDEYFSVGKDSVTFVKYLRLAELDTTDTTVEGGTMAFDGIYGWMYDGTEWLKMTFAASGGVTITEVRSEIADSLDAMRADTLTTYVTVSQLIDSLDAWRADSLFTWVTVTQLEDSLNAFAADSLTKWVTFTQLVDSLLQIRTDLAGAGGGGGGDSLFVDLQDTPGDFTDDAGKFVVVNNAEDALEFTHNPHTQYFTLDAGKGQTDLDSAITAIQALVTGNDYAEIFLMPGIYNFSTTRQIDRFTIRGSNTIGKQTYYSGSVGLGETNIVFSDELVLRGYTTIKDVSVTVASTNLFACFYVEYTGNSVDNTVFDNVSFYDVDNNNTNSSPAFINITEAGVASVVNCSFYGTTASVEKYSGIYTADDGCQLYIEDCYFSGMDEGLYLYHPSTGLGGELIFIKGCVFDNNDVGIRFELSTITAYTVHLIGNTYYDNDLYDIEITEGVGNIWCFNDNHRTINYAEWNSDFNYYKDNQHGEMSDITGTSFTAQTGYLLLGGIASGFTYSEAAQTGAYTTPTWYYDYTDTTLTIPSDWPGEYKFVAYINVDEGTGDDDYTWACDIDGTQYSEVYVNGIAGEYQHFTIEYTFKATGGEVVGLAVKAPNGASAFSTTNVRWTLTRIGDIASIN